MLRFLAASERFSQIISPTFACKTTWWYTQWKGTPVLHYVCAKGIRFMRLQNKVALVTGASSGIGKAIATRFAAEGAHVAVNYRPGGQFDVDAAVAEAAAFGTTSIAIAADVSKREDVERMVQQVVAQFGRLDILVNNAGIEINKPFLEVTDDEWRSVIAVNLYGPFVVSQVAARQMAQQGQGKIINISSVHEDIPFPEYTAYCVSK